MRRSRSLTNTEKERENYEKLNINPSNRGVPLFMNEVESKTTTKPAAEDGRSNAFVAVVYPKRLGVANTLAWRTLRLLSFKDLYVTNVVQTM